MSSRGDLITELPNYDASQTYCLLEACACMHAWTGRMHIVPRHYLDTSHHNSEKKKEPNMQNKEFIDFTTAIISLSSDIG
jgi:hypothetical protein